MATSESDDFESADEELNVRAEQTNKPKRYASIGSDSDDDVDYIPVQCRTQIRASNQEDLNPSSRQKHSSLDKVDDKFAKANTGAKSISHSDDTLPEKNTESLDDRTDPGTSKSSKEATLECESDFSKSGESMNRTQFDPKIYSIEKSKSISGKQERPPRQRKLRETQSGAKKMGAVKIDRLPDVEVMDEDANKGKNEKKLSSLNQECWEEFQEMNLEEELKSKELETKLRKENQESEESMNVPEELRSNLKFKDIFKPDGWEGLGNDVELPDDLSDDKYHPVLDKLTANDKEQSSQGSWSEWSNWGMNSLRNTANIGVIAFTNHFNQGLSLLEETIGVPDPVNLAKSESLSDKNVTLNEKSPEEQKADKTQSSSSSFGFGNFISSMSSISKLVESTSTKVISGGLDTLETIGKKTMEVLQEGDPGFKKKRAFLLNDTDKPILSQILREAKEKADIEEKSAEEKQLLRKVHFESLFDDYQGLMHLEALEILSKQCNIKIQQHLINLDGSELTSMQETLDEVKDLCDLGDEEDEDDEEQNKKDLNEKLQEACKDLDISITYDKLIEIWNDIDQKFSQGSSNNILHREVFQKAISSLAEFTGYSVERFHKTAELLLIKKRRSTVNEADCLIQLTNILSSQISLIANIYCCRLKEDYKNELNRSEIDSALKTISLEATNASSYIQEAFRLLIPILQVGAI